MFVQTEEKGNSTTTRDMMFAQLWFVYNTLSDCSRFSGKLTTAVCIRLYIRKFPCGMAMSSFQQVVLWERKGFSLVGLHVSLAPLVFFYRLYA
jgi:hypothetical protein